MIFFLIVLLCIDDCDQILVSVPINYSESYDLQSGNMIGLALAPKDLDGGIFNCSFFLMIVTFGLLLFELPLLLHM